MYVYKFRLTFDEVEDFVRDYEILSNQTFLDFHNIIIQSINLNSKELASFYIADHRWEKHKEITLMDMMDEEEEQAEVPKSVMADAVLSDYIDDPHQKMIYEYDFLNLKTFYIELLKTSKVDDAAAIAKYPKCTHSKGEIPKSCKELSPDELLIDNFDDDVFTDDDGYNPEDLEDFHDDFEI